MKCRENVGKIGKIRSKLSGMDLEEEGRGGNEWIERNFSLFLLFEEREYISMNISHIASKRSVCPVNNLETSDAFPVYCFPRQFQGRDFARRRCIVRWSGREFVAPCILEQPLIFKRTHASFRGSRNSFSKKLGYEPKYRIPKSFCPEIDAPSFFDTTKRGSYIYMYERKL